jgi:glycosyltransferase involved in cell wall biosynthesis
VHSLVRRLLALPDDDIEVVVLDNDSKDGTAETLGKIDDPRFKLASNPENRGALFNMVNVFSFATGDYVVYSTDQDKTNVERLSEFKTFLREHPNVSCGFCNFDVDPETPHRVFIRGFDAVDAIAYKGRHPTGYFFRSEELREVRLAERFSDFNVVDLFPLEFAFAEVALQGDGAIYNGGLFSPNNGEDVVQHKSATTNGASPNAFFAPAARLKLALAYTKHIDQLALTPRDRSRLIGHVFLNEFLGATFVYRAVMRNERLCIHYRMDPRRIKYAEMLQIGVDFVRRYFSTIIVQHRVSVTRVTVGILEFALRKLARRLVR